MQTITLTPRPAFAFESVTVDNTAGGVALTAATYRKQVGPGAADVQNARQALITCETAEVRYKLVPATTLEAAAGGHLLAVDGGLILEGQQIVDFRAIRTGGTSGTLRVTYFL